MSKIEWTDKTWNPITGCTKCSPGCVNCYAEVMARRLKAMGLKKYRNGFDLTVHRDSFDEPYRWKTPKKIFVCSMSDIFHESVSDETLFKIFSTMCNAQFAYGHRFFILTKRPRRMNDFIEKVRLSIEKQRKPRLNPDGSKTIELTFQFPLNNIWLGVTVCNQEEANEKIPVLIDVPATMRFISIEPMLETISLNEDMLKKLDWVIVGGETGANKRPINPDWARSIRNQCKDAKIPFFFKKIDGRQTIPDDLMIREFPKVRNR